DVMGFGTVTNCTIVGNLASNKGGGISKDAYYFSSFPIITNCILWDNLPTIVQFVTVPKPITS
ncbi:unnamed protein product, partial [marine sediment metagenome]